jgi:phage replication-related protein YjqB (UPF0714/DUF867 family)
MTDRYPDFCTLARHERAGVDYAIGARQRRAAFAIAAPHGGGIEPGTSELADAVAAADWSFYAFAGLKAKANGDLHITSTRFDEPICLALIARSECVITLHGEGSDEARVFLGGLDRRWGSRIAAALRARGFVVSRHADPALQGLEPNNLCNRGRARAGVQLELSRGLRERMFRSLSSTGRRHPKAPFRAFVRALCDALAPGLAPGRAPGRASRAR